MRTLTIALVLVALVATQASYLETIFNHTNLRGKGTFNTTNGLNMGYNGSLYYNLSGYTINILDIGAQFNAVPESWRASPKAQSSNVKYSGSIDILQSGIASSVSINGVTGVSNEVSSTYNNKSGVTNITFNQAVNDSNSFAFRTGSTLVSARSSTGLSAAGLIQQKGNNLKLVEGVSVNADVKGSIFKNGTSLGAFAATQATSATVSERVHVDPTATGFKPNVDFVGKAKFTSNKSLSFANTTTSSSKKGGAKYGGQVWVKNKNGSSGVAVAEGVGYGFKEILTVNNATVAKTHAKGIAGIYHATQTNSTVNGSSVASYQAGKFQQFSKTWLPPKNKSQKRIKPRKYVEMVDSKDEFFGSEESGEYFDIDESGEFFKSASPKVQRYSQKVNHKHHNRPSHHSIKAFVEGNWKSGSLTTTKLVTNTTSIVNSTNAVVYSAKGWDSKTKKPWKYSGNKTVSASFEQSVSSTNLNDIVAKVDSNPAFTSKVGSLPDPKLQSFNKDKSFHKNKSVHKKHSKKHN